MPNQFLIQVRFTAKSMAARKAIPLRLSEDIFQALKHWAEDDLRSVNAQIEYLLRESLCKSGRLAKKNRAKETR